MKRLLSETPSHREIKPFWIQGLCICKNHHWLPFSGMLSSTCKSALFNDDFGILSASYRSLWCLVLFFQLYRSLGTANIPARNTDTLFKDKFICAGSKENVNIYMNQTSGTNNLILFQVKNKSNEKKKSFVFLEFQIICPL